MGTEVPIAVVIPPYREATRAVPGGFISAALSFMDEATLPAGERVTLARAGYSPAAPPGCTLIELAHRDLAVPGSPPVGINFVVAGRFGMPRLVHELIDAGPCAAGSRVSGSAGGEPGAAVFRLRVRR